jgi:hypothetical protein
MNSSLQNQDIDPDFDWENYIIANKLLNIFEEKVAWLHWIKYGYNHGFIYTIKEKSKLDTKSIYKN